MNVFKSLSHMLILGQRGSEDRFSLADHAHFLFRTGEGPVATVMRRLFTGQVVSFNRGHRRHGHLFQNRYKSIICQEERYFKELVRHLQLNPLRARIVPDVCLRRKGIWREKTFDRPALRDLFKSFKPLDTEMLGGAEVKGARRSRCPLEQYVRLSRPFLLTNQAHPWPHE